MGERQPANSSALGVRALDYHFLCFFFCFCIFVLILGFMSIVLQFIKSWTINTELYIIFPGSEGIPLLLRHNKVYPTCRQPVWNTLISTISKSVYSNCPESSICQQSSNYLFLCLSVYQPIYHVANCFLPILSYGILCSIFFWRKSNRNAPMCLLLQSKNSASGRN